MTDVLTRRSDARSRIVDAAARLMGERGAAAVTTRGVAEAAGVQAPAIYRLFGDKDGLLEAVAEQVMASHVSIKARTVEVASSTAVDPLEDLRAGWDAQVAFGLAHPALFHLMSDPSRAARSPAVRAGLQVLADRVHRVAATGRLRVGEQRAVDLVHAAGTGAVLTLLARPQDERDPALADDLFHAVLARILTGTPAPPEGPAAAVVAVRAAVPDLDVLTPSERGLLAEWLDRAVAAGMPAGGGPTAAGPGRTPRRR